MGRSALSLSFCARVSQSFVDEQSAAGREVAARNQPREGEGGKVSVGVRGAMVRARGTCR